MDNDNVKSVHTFEYSDQDLVPEINAHSDLSKFDVFLRGAWQDSADKGHFKYTLNNVQTKVSEGQPTFIMQLNPERGNKRRAPAPMTDMDMTFDPKAFNFNKIKPCEILCRLQPHHSAQNAEHLLIINVSPLEFGHVLLVPDTKACLPQRLVPGAARLGVDLMLLSTHRGFRVGFNSLLAMASVNHLHLHAWYLPQVLPLQTAEVKRICGRLHETVEYFAPAFVFQLYGSDSETLAQDVERVAGHLQSRGVAHNVFMTRGAVFGEEVASPHSTLRVFLWPRKSVTGAKETSTVAFNVAVAELAGHVPMYDEESFRSYSGKEIHERIQEYLLSSEEWNRIRDSVQIMFNSDVKVS